MSLHRLLVSSVARRRSTILKFHNLAASPQDPTPPRHSLYPFPTFSSFDEAVSERLRRISKARVPPRKHPRHPNEAPEATSALIGTKLILDNRVQFLIRATDLDTAERIAHCALITGDLPTVFTCNSIIAAMYTAKRYDDVVKLFDYYFNQYRIIPNIDSYNILINTHCDCGDVDLALHLYKKQISPFTTPSPVTYTHLTKGLIDASRFVEALDMLIEMLIKGHGVSSISMVINNVITGFLKLGDLEKADELIHQFKQVSSVHDGLLNATYIDWWFNQGKEKEAMDSYKSLMKDRKFKMAPTTCNFLLQTLLKHRRKQEALDLFHRMLDNHSPPDTQAVNSETFNIMVNDSFKSGNFSEAIHTFTKNVGSKPASKPFAMDVAGYNNIITRFCQHGLLAEAENFFNILKSSESVMPDCETYTTLIDAYLKMERIDDALNMLNKMVDANLRVVGNFGTRVFEELIKKGKASECRQIISKMGLKDPLPAPAVYDAVIRGLVNAGALDEAWSLMRETSEHLCGPTPYTLELYCKAVGRPYPAE